MPSANLIGQKIVSVPMMVFNKEGRRSVNHDLRESSLFVPNSERPAIPCDHRVGSRRRNSEILGASSSAAVGANTHQPDLVLALSLVDQLALKISSIFIRISLNPILPSASPLAQGRPG